MRSLSEGRRGETEMGMKDEKIKEGKDGKGNEKRSKGEKEIEMKCNEEQSV